MGPTLDDLLSASGISDLAPMTKTAAPIEEEHVRFLKLAQRCERASTSRPAPPAASSNLAEKTAGVAVIAATLAEIDAITSGEEKVAAGATSSENVAFIKAALDEGYSEEQIALFLKQAGRGDFVARVRHGLKARSQLGAGMALEGQGLRLQTAGIQEAGALLRNASRSLTPDAANRLVEKLRARYGDAKAAHLVHSSGAHMNHLQAVRDLKSHMPAGAPAATANIGGKAYSVTNDQLKAMAKPAAIGAAGLVGGKMLFGGGDGDGGKKKGVVVINS